MASKFRGPTNIVGLTPRKSTHWMEMNRRHKMTPATPTDDSAEPEPTAILFSNTDNVQKLKVNF